MLDFLLIGLVAVAGLVLAYIVFRPKPAETPHARSTAAPTRESLLMIAIPATGDCCAAARKLETHRFHKGHEPALPLADCNMKPGCHCRYQPFPERRIGERRMGDEKRDTIRYEENPRREGRGRREQDKLFDPGKH